MSKYTFLLFKTLLITAFLGNSQNILGKDALRSVDLKEIENKSTIEAQNPKKMMFMIG